MDVEKTLPPKRRFARCRFVAKWGFVLTVLVGLAAAFYLNGRMNEELRRRIEARFAENYPRLVVSVRSAQLIDGEGIEIRGLSFVEPGLSGPQAELAHFDEVFLLCSTDLSQLLSGELDVRHVVVRRPTLRAARRDDGSWTIDQLLPLPKFSEQPPDGTVENAVVELYDALDSQRTSFTIRDVNLALTPEPRESTTDARGSLIRVRGDLAADYTRRVALNGVFEPDGARWSLNGTWDGLDFCPELCAALPTEASSRLRQIASLRAQVTGGFQLQYERGTEEPLRFVVSGQLTEGRVDDPRAPYPLNDLQAAFRMENQFWAIDDLSARNGQTTLELSCRQEGYSADSPLVLEAESRRMVLDQQLFDVLPSQLRAYWDRAMPSGVVDARLKLAFDGVAWRPDITVRCLDVAFTYDKFPYRLERGAGTVEWKDDALAVDLKAYSGSRQVRIGAEVARPGPDGVGWIDIDGDNLRLDEKLLAALPVAYRHVIRDLNPEGTFNLAVRCRRTTAESPEFSKEITISLNRCAIRHERFPYPLGNIRGTIALRDGVWQFQDLEGANDSGRVTCFGRMTPVEAGGELMLHFVGHRIPFEDELRDALSPSVQQVWRSLRPQGALDFWVDVRYQAGSHRLEILRVRGQSIEDQGEMTAVSIEPDFFRYPMMNLRGAFEYRADAKRVTLETIRADHGRTKLATGGYFEPRPDGSWRLQLLNVAVDRLRVDRELVAALPQRLGASLAELKPEGPISLRGSVGFVGGQRPAVPLRSEWDLAVDFQGVSFDMGLPLTHLYGGMRLAGAAQGEQFQTQGELSIDSLTCQGVQLTNILGPILIDESFARFGRWAEPQAPAQSGRPLTANLWGGAVVGDGWIARGPERRYVFKASLAEADLAQSARDLVAGRPTLTGKMLAQVDLRGVGRGLNNLGGRGEVRLRDADIYRLPVMVEMLSLLSVKTPDNTAFTGSDIFFRIEAGHVYFDRINFNGDAISLYGRGEMGLDKSIQLEFYSVVGRDQLQVPLLRELIGGASQQFMAIHVDGVVGAPRVRTEAFPGVRQIVEQLQNDLQAPVTSLRRPPVEGPAPAARGGFPPDWFRSLR